MTLAVAALVAFCIVADIGRELCFKLAADQAVQAPGYARALASSPFAWGGVGLWLVEMLAWVAVLQSAPLTVAFPMMAAVYAGVPAAAALVLREAMSRSQMAGAALVALGVFCVGLSELRP